ncbi:helix-turn-helix transcriptional regulator [Schaalia sp. 19OD2882]|uniref:helix-turn-helix transcriptional regulator n=1 Tax=Schaalia sp. 19OD2882 TaxID=2794089 RepID=UPI0026599D3F|nr:helix-turn-helix transcriptional regulator [Schaalia sp. 19OD2882]
MKNKVKELRTEARLTQAELGARLGVSRQTVIAIETGKYDPSLALAFTIAREFALSIEEVFDPELPSAD